MVHHIHLEQILYASEPLENQLVAGVEFDAGLSIDAFSPQLLQSLVRNYLLPWMHILPPLKMNLIRSRGAV